MDEDRQAELNAALRKGLLLLVAFAAVVALGTFVVVHALGLDARHGSTNTVLGQPAPVSPLPTTALPVPGSSGSRDSSGGSSSGAGNGGADAPPSSQPGPRHHASRGLRLNASPASVAPMERINLTGTWPGHDNVGLQVQRLQNGTWTTFPTTTTVQAGTFETYVETGHAGVNEFRVQDPGTGTVSNSVRVTVR